MLGWTTLCHDPDVRYPEVEMDADLIESDLKYNVNPFLIQPCYRYEVVLNDEGVPTITTGEHVCRKDSYWEQCPKAHRVE